MVTKKQALLHLAAEIEALFSRPGSPLHWRRRELRSLGIETGAKFWVGQHLFILNSGKITIGERVALGEFVQLYNHAQIEIGHDFLCAGNLIINTGSHDPLTLLPKGRPTRIGNRVWCGIRVTILDGVTIGDDVVLGAGCLVNKDIPANCIVAGVPARIIRNLNRDTETELWSWPIKRQTPIRLLGKRPL